MEGGLNAAALPDLREHLPQQRALPLQVRGPGLVELIELVQTFQLLPLEGLVPWVVELSGMHTHLWIHRPAPLFRPKPDIFPVHQPGQAVHNLLAWVQAQGIALGKFSVFHKHLNPFYSFRLA